MPALLRYALITLLMLIAAACSSELPNIPPASQPDAAAPAALPETSPSPLPPTPTAAPFLPAATPTAEPIAAPTHAPVLRQLTSGGCCVEPFWSPDSQRLLYLDKPFPDAPAGFYSVNVQDGGVSLFTDRLGLFSPDMSLRAFPDGKQTIVERLEDGQRWVIPSAGRAVSFSPDGAQVAWTAGQSGPPFDTARREIWTSQADGSQAKALLQLYSGGFAGWFPDGRILINGRMTLNEPMQGLWAYSPQDGSALPLGSGERLRGVAISPGGSWVTYQVLFSSNPDENGTWLVNTRTGEKRRLDLFGAYRWRDDGRLLLIPLDANQPSHQIWQIDAASGQAQALTDPGATPIKVANGDWSVSPDGTKVAFLSAHDHNIWVIELAD
jgi:Tol biopolymer transport system component